MPASTDEHAALMGELAISSVVRAIGWDIKEIERPTETELTIEEIIKTSETLFGDERYGRIAEKYLEWMRHAAYGRVLNISSQHYFDFDYSRFWHYYPTFEERIDVESYAGGREIRRAVLPVLDTMSFPFAHSLKFYPSFRHEARHPSRGDGFLVARAVPETLTKERLANFLQTPNKKSKVAPADHTLRGDVGRMYDTLIVASGLRDSVNSSKTEPGDTISYEEFKAFAAREGVTKGMLKTLNDKLHQGLAACLHDAAPPTWGEIVVAGGIDFYRGPEPGFRSIEFDEIAVSTLAAVDKAYSSISPQLQAVLDLYKSPTEDLPTI